MTSCIYVTELCDIYCLDITLDNLENSLVDNDVLVFLIYISISISIYAYVSYSLSVE